VKAEKISEVYNKRQKRDLPLALVVRKLEHAVSRFFLNFFVAALNLSPCFQRVLFTGPLLSDESQQREHLDECFQGASGTSLHIEKTRTPCPTLIQPTPEALATKTTFLCICYLMFQIWVCCESIWIGKLTHVHIICSADETTSSSDKSSLKWVSPLRDNICPNGTASCEMPIKTKGRILKPRLCNASCHKIPPWRRVACAWSSFMNSWWYCSYVI